MSHTVLNSVKTEKPVITVDQIPAIKLDALGKLLYVAANEWFSDPANMRKYEVDTNEKAS